MAPSSCLARASLASLVATASCLNSASLLPETLQPFSVGSAALAGARVAAPELEPYDYLLLRLIPVAHTSSVRAPVLAARRHRRRWIHRLAHALGASRSR